MKKLFMFIVLGSMILLARSIVIYGAQYSGTGPLNSAHFEGSIVTVPKNMFIKSIESEDSPSFCLININTGYELCIKTSLKNKYIGKSIPAGKYRLLPNLPYYNGIRAMIARVKVVVTDKRNLNHHNYKSYIGCYKDKGDPWGTRGRDLNGKFISKANMSIEKCINLCSNYGYKYAGLQYSKQCFCGNSYGKYGRANNCNMRCSGNYNQTCGGVWANSVYRVSKKNIIPYNQTTYEKNTDRMGMDYRDFNLPRADAKLCQKACIKDKRCKAWTYVKPNTIQGPNPRCWLKYGIPKAIHKSCCISGVKKIKSLKLKEKIFYKPKIGTYRLDWCKNWGTACGKEAANAFCKYKGFNRAIYWHIDENIGLHNPTKVITTGEICNQSFCDGFKYIKCTR